jgi:hypothetical protein
VAVDVGTQEYLSALWAAAGILVAFQTAALILRINREIEVGKQRDYTRLPLADGLNILSIALILLGVLAARAINFVSSQEATLAFAFAFAALLLAFYPFALAGHYEMFNPVTPRSMSFVTLQEAIALTVTLAAGGALIVLGAYPWALATLLLLPVLLMTALAWWQVLNGREKLSAVRKEADEKELNARNEERERATLLERLSSSLGAIEEMASVRRSEYLHELELVEREIFYNRGLTSHQRNSFRSKAQSLRAEMTACDEEVQHNRELLRSARRALMPAKVESTTPVPETNWRREALHIEEFLRSTRRRE